MAITTLSSHEFDKHIGRAKKAAESGPVFINDRGKPAYVLLTIGNYERLKGKDVSVISDRPSVPISSSSGDLEKSIIDILGMPPGIEDVELDIPRDGSLPRLPDFD